MPVLRALDGALGIAMLPFVFAIRAIKFVFTATFKREKKNDVAVSAAHEVAKL